MEKEFLSTGILLLMTALSLAGTAMLWRRVGRAGRALGIIAIAAGYLVAAYLLSVWASAGGWPEGMFFMMVAMVAVPVATIVLLVLLIVALFGGAAGSWRRPAMIASFTVLALILLAIAFNRHLRLAWHRMDLDDPNPDRRAHAVLMLGQTRLKAAVPLVVEAARDEDPSVRENAILSLASIDDTGALPIVRRALSDEDAGVREMAVMAVVPLGRGGPEVTADLKRMLSDPDPGVRKAAEEGLDSIEPNWRTSPDIPETYRER